MSDVSAIEARGEGDAAAWNRPALIALALLVCAACISLCWLVHPYYEAGTGTNDGSMYIISARSLLAGEGYAYLGRPFTVRPPGMSVAIAPLIAWRGLDFFALNLFVSLCGVAGVVLLFVLVRPRLGTWLAFAVALALWLNPAYQHMCNQVMSDVPGTMLLLACLLLERWASRAPSPRRELVLAAAIGIASYMRTINVLLVPAILAARASAQWLSMRARTPSARAPARSRSGTGSSSGTSSPSGTSSQRGATTWLGFVLSRVLPLALVVWLVLLPWSVRNARNPPQAPVDQNFIYSYSSGMWNVDAGDPASARVPLETVLARVPERGGQILALLGSSMQQSSGEADDFGRTDDSGELLDLGLVLRRTLGAVMLALAAWTLFAKRRASELMLFAALGVLSIYFRFQDRLVLPIYVLALPAALEAIVALAARFVALSISRIAVAVLVAILALSEFRPRAGWDRIAALHQSYQRSCGEIERKLPADARLAAPIGWHYSVYLDRPVYSLLFAMRRTRDVSGAEQVIDEYGINTVILAPFSPSEEQLLTYFHKRYGNVDQTAEGIALVRVRK